MKGISVIVLVVLAMVISLDVVEGRVIRYQHGEAPKGWREIDILPFSSQPVQLHLALRQRNMDVIEQRLLQTSNPHHPSYGQWFSLNELEKLISPTPTDYQSVVEWLHSHEIYHLKTRPTRDWIIVETTVGVAERLLQCEMMFFEQIFTKKRVIRATDSYSIPSEVEHVVDFVAGLHGFPYSNWKQQSIYSSRQTDSYDLVTPDIINAAYDITPLTESCNCNSTQAIVEFDQANLSPTDLETFFLTYVPEFSGQTVSGFYGGGTNRPFSTSVEANLDIQYVMGVGSYIPTYDYVLRYRIDILDAFLDYLYLVGEQENPPLVHSISYGQYGGQYDNSTVQRINSEFMLMASRGLTVVLASGDNGVGCGEDCTSQEFDFPSSPWVTMVGATVLNTDTLTENAADFSSGGFSGDYYTPSWQQEAVDGYFESGIELPTISYNRTGRGYPDVSIVGANLAVIWNDFISPVGGTSASAPIFSGIISLLNAERSMAGKSSLGCVNPWLYSNTSMFNDVIYGLNSYGCCEGFYASPGWDPISGLGTPRYDIMLDSALRLP